MSAAVRPSHLLSDAITWAGSRLRRSGRLMRAPIWIYRMRLGFLFTVR